MLTLILACFIFPVSRIHIIRPFYCKTTKRAAIVRPYPAPPAPPPPPLPLSAVFSCFHTTVCEDYSFTTDGYDMFNVRTQIWVRAVHTRGDMAQTSLHKS